MLFENQTKKRNIKISKKQKTSTKVAQGVVGQVVAVEFIWYGVGRDWPSHGG